MAMKDRSKQLSKMTWKDPTRSLSRLAKVESKLVALFRNYRRRVLAELKPAEQPFTQMEQLTQKWPVSFSIEHFYQRLEDLTPQELIGPATAILEKEIPDAFTHGTKYADLNLKAKMGIKLGAPLEERQRAWQKVGALVEKSKGEFKGVSDAVNQQIRRAVADGMVNEDSLSTVTKKIQDVSESVGEVRARTIARTETMKAINTGVKDRYAKIGIDKVEWLAAEDERTCEVCGDLDGRTFPLGETPECPAHPNCIHPDTMIQKEGIISGFRASYSGPMIEIAISNGQKISITPNHMLLTDRGFAAADLICEGDKILYCTGFERIIPTHPDHNNVPTRIQDIVDPLTVSCSMLSRGVPVTPEDFHGDGRFCNGNVDIICPNCLLRDAVKTTGFQQRPADNFDPASKSKIPLLSSSALHQFLLRAGHTSYGIMSSTRKSAAFFRRRLRHTEQHGIAFSTGSDTEQFEPSGNSPSVYPENLMNGLDGLASIVELQDVVAVNIMMYTGHVYDLQTLSSLYIANGLILSNCRCTLIPFVDEGDEEEATQKDEPEQITGGQGRFL